MKREFGCAAGPFFGGKQPAVSDGFPVLSRAEHLQRVVVANNPVANVNVGFAFNAITNTIDAAAKCLPEGWKLYRMAEPASGAFGWSAVRKMVKVGVLATDDEATDRFRLAVKAIMAMEEGK